jgi:hypothetical protein
VHILRTNSTGPLFEHDQSFEIICQHTWLGVGGVKIKSGVVRRCQNCRTEYRIDFKYYENHGSTVFFTRWKDLGPGPESEVWMQHIYPISSFETRRLNHGGASNLGHRGFQTNQNIGTHGGYLSGAFEDGHDFKVDSWLTLRNIRELFLLQD